MALLVVNDHVLKQAFPGVITGKLSDVAGLAFFPVLLWSLVEVVLRRPLPASATTACIALTGVAFALVKTWEPAADVWRFGMGALQWPVRALAGHPGFLPVRLVVDPTDLVALPALVVPWAVARRRARADTERA